MPAGEDPVDEDVELGATEFMLEITNNPKAILKMIEFMELPLLLQIKHLRPLMRPRRSTLLLDGGN